MDINTKDTEGNFVLVPLPYTDDHLENYLSETTVRLHYYKHLQTYIDNVNALKKGLPLQDCPLQTIISGATSQTMFNNASQVFNHYFYFEALNPKGSRFPQGKLLALIEGQFGSFTNFVEDFRKTAKSIFGSGWVFLVLNGRNKLEIASYIGTGTPQKRTPLLALDMWEHAYYIDYHNRKDAYITTFFQLVDWNVVEYRLENYERI